MTDRISLEKEAVAFSDANAPHPRIYELAPEEGRVLLEEVQESPVNKYSVDIEDYQLFFIFMEQAGFLAVLKPMIN